MIANRGVFQMDRPILPASTGATLMTTHDAILQARLDDQHAHAHAAHPMDAETPERAPNRALAGATALRVRVGHHLVAIGAAVAGDDERTHADRAA
jgi:hypothetical protein